MVVEELTGPDHERLQAATPESQHRTGAYQLRVQIRVTRVLNMEDRIQRFKYCSYTML